MGGYQQSCESKSDPGQKETLCLLQSKVEKLNRHRKANACKYYNNLWYDIATMSRYAAIIWDYMLPWSTMFFLPGSSKWGRISIMISRMNRLKLELGKAARKEVTDLLIKLGMPAMDLTSNMKRIWLAFIYYNMNIIYVLFYMYFMRLWMCDSFLESWNLARGFNALRDDVYRITRFQRSQRPQKATPNC